MPHTRHNAPKPIATPAATAPGMPVLDVREVRVALIRRGSSLRAWARSRGHVNSGFVHLVIAGRRHGPTATRLLTELREDTGL